MNIFPRRNLNDIVQVMLYDESDSSSGSDSEDDLEVLMLEYIFPLTSKNYHPCVNLQDISDTQCEVMFRYEQ